MPQQADVARAAAVQLRQGLAVQLLISPAYLIICGSQLAVARDGLQLMSALLMGLFVVVLALAAWQYQRTGRFLEYTAAPVITETPQA